jgi:hypothetical protein
MAMDWMKSVQITETIPPCDVYSVAAVPVTRMEAQIGIGVNVERASAGAYLWVMRAKVE